MRKLKSFTVLDYLTLKRKNISDDEIAVIKGVHPNTLLNFKRENGLVRGENKRQFNYEFIEDITPEDFSDFVQYMRRSISLSKRDFALAMGVTINTINNWEQASTIPQDLHAVIRTMRIVVKLRIKNKRLIA